MIARREMMKKAGAATALLLGPGLPVWAQPSSAPPQSASAPFMGLSSALIGIDEENLRPALPQDGFQLSDVYYGIWTVALGGGIAKPNILDDYDELLKNRKKPDEIANAMLRSELGKSIGLRQDRIGTASRLLALLWLYGVWFGGTEIEENSNASNFLASGFKEDFVVSSRAYKEGWIWRIAQAHAMGYSHFNFGSWADVPPSLSDYGISLA